MGVTWLKTGEASVNAAKQAQAEYEQRKAELGKLWRWWLGVGKSGRLTFVDGVLSPQGFLVPPRFYEHNLYLNGKWGNLYVCPEKTNPGSGEKCPLCEGGDKPQLVSVFTVVDQRSFTTKKGETVPFQRRLFVATEGTFEILNKLAIKRGGLVGLTFEVTRTKDKAPRVGDVFDFEEKGDPEALKKKFAFSYKDKDGKVVTGTHFEPADYEKEIVYRSADELRKMGLGLPPGSAPAMGTTSGGAAGQGSSTAEGPADAADYAEQL